MSCFPNDPELLSPAVSHSFALRRNIRIKTSKLPPDFFLHPHPGRYGLSPLSSRQMGLDLSNREVRTPSFDCRKHESAGRVAGAGEERKAETARGAVEKHDELGCTFSGVLGGRRVKRESRQQSIDFKNSCSIDLDEQQWRLPKILNRGFHPRR
jgi:hypothetical protein